MPSAEHMKWLAARWVKGLRSGELRRGAVYKVAGRFSPAIVVDRGSGAYLVPTNDLMGLRTFMMGHYELNVMRDAMTILGRWLDRDPLRGRIMIEVGANMGTTTVPALTEFGASRVIAIEPDAGNLHLLRSTIELNGLTDRVTFVHAAASDIAGTVELELSADSIGDHRIRTTTDLAPEMGELDRETVSVPARPIDDIIASTVDDPTEIGLIWMDIQGHEGQALVGAANAIKAGIPALIEYWPYGLRRAGGLEVLHEVLREQFQQVIDVRSGPNGTKLSKADLGSLPSRYSAFNAQTDLLLLP